METALTTIMEATHFAAVKHKDQRRKDKCQTPYINHPIGVARILSHEASICDVDVLVAALLHDTVEDTDCSHEEIEAKFGEKVSAIVRECSDDKNLPKAERKRLQIAHAPHASREAKLVKLADKLYNLRDLEQCTPEGWDEQRVQEYFRWAADVVDAGLRGVSAPLEAEMNSIFRRRDVRP